MEQRRRLIRQVVRQARQSGSDFYEIVRNLEKVDPGLPRLGLAEDLRDEAVRFGQKPSLRSCLPEVTAISESTVDARSADVDLGLFGLLGVSGPLPLELTAKIFQLSNNAGNYALERFLNLINHRFAVLLYRAYAQRHLAFSSDREEQDLNRAVVRALAGAAVDGKYALPPFTAEAVAPYVMRGYASARGIEMALRQYFAQDVRVISNAFDRYVIPERYSCRLSCDGGNVLGTNIQVGRHFYSHTKLFVLEVGPLDFARCQQMLPGTAAFRDLMQILFFFLHRPFHFDLRFVLRRSSLTGITLNGRYALGRSTFFKYRDDKGEKGLCTLSIRATRLSAAGHDAGSAPPGAPADAETAAA